MRCLYTDLDGTLLGRDASLLADAEGAFTLFGVRALEACHRAGAEVVFYSGRRHETMAATCRFLGLASYIFEAGAGLVVDGELEWLTGSFLPGARTIHEQITDSGAPALLLEHYAGRLEYHEPWHENRDVSHLFRGLVDAFEADALLADHGHADLRLVDNGVVNRRSPALAGLPHVRAYHLVPGRASKANAVARHRQIRGLAREDCLAVGDSREDMGAAEVVGRFWLVRNAVEKDPTIAGAAEAYGNVRVAEERNGAGVYEAVVTTLAERGGG